MAPKGWPNFDLGAAITIVPGFPFESGHFNTAGQGAPLIRIRDLLTNAPSVGYTGEIPDGYWVNNGDLLIGMDGDFNIVKWNGGKALLNQRLCSVKTSATDVLDQDFLFHFLTPWLLRIHSEIGATTVKHLSTKHLSGIRTPLPPIDEQRCISAVLTAVDDAALAAQAAVEQARLARDAVLDGLLAGDQWPRATFGTLVRVGSGYAFKANDFTDAATDIPVVRMSNLKTGRLDLSEAKRLPSGLLHGLDAFQLQAGDFVFGMSGSLTNHAWVTASDLPCCQNQRVGRLLPKNGTHPRFAAYLYLSDHVQQGITQLAAGAAQLNISASQIESIVVPCPPPEAQARIASILTDLDDAITQDQRHLESLRITKRGLLDDLLTGRVRVPATALSEASHAP